MEIAINCRTTLTFAEGVNKNRKISKHGTRSLRKYSQKLKFCHFLKAGGYGSLCGGFSNESLSHNQA